MVVAYINRRRRALEDEELGRVAREIRDALDRGGSGADDAHSLVGQLLHRGTAPVAAGVVIIPARSMESVASEGLDSGDARQLRASHRSGAHGDESCPEAVTAIGLDLPARRLVVPFETGHLGREERLVGEIKGLGDALCVFEDLPAVDVLLAGHIPGLFE